MNENGRFKVAFTLGTAAGPHASLFSAPLRNASTLGHGWERSAPSLGARRVYVRRPSPAPPRPRSLTRLRIQFGTAARRAAWSSRVLGLPLTRVLRSPSTRAAMDGRRSPTVVRTPLARGDARLVRASNPILPAKRCCCSCARAAALPSRVLWSRRVRASRAESQPDRRTERRDRAQSQPAIEGPSASRSTALFVQRLAQDA